MIICPKCGSENNSTSLYCEACGAYLESSTCPSCGRPLAKGEVCLFCLEKNTSAKKTAASSVLSSWAYAGLLFLSLIPLIGFIFMVVWACGAGKNKSLHHFARGVLIVKLILLILFGGLTAVFSIFGAPEAAMDFFNPYSYYSDDFYEDFFDFYDDYDFGAYLPGDSSSNPIY